MADAEGRRFGLAPMTTGLRVLTWALMVVPLHFAVATTYTHGVVRSIMAGACAFVVLVYASVWFWFRPTAFFVLADRLRVVWPLRWDEVDLRGASVEILSAGDFRARYGFGMRIGAGGLWGGFGLMRCAGETFRLYISRTDAFVVLRPRVGRSWLITPEDPEGFVREIRARAR